MASLIEQETIVTAGRTEAVVYIWTSNPVHLRRLRKDPRATETAGGIDYGQFTIPSDGFDPLKGFKRKGRVMSDEEKAAAGERLRAARG
jgi:hypothetical protein